MPTICSGKIDARTGLCIRLLGERVVKRDNDFNRTSDGEFRRQVKHQRVSIRDDFGAIGT
jgi:hypothetical protein